VRIESESFRYPPHSFPEHYQRESDEQQQTNQNQEAGLLSTRRDGNKLAIESFGGDQAKKTTHHIRKPATTQLK
jgi:hypothetical protein